MGIHRVVMVSDLIPPLPEKTKGVQNGGQMLREARSRAKRQSRGSRKLSKMCPVESPRAVKSTETHVFP